MRYSIIGWVVSFACLGCNSNGGSAPPRDGGGGASVSSSAASTATAGPTNASATSGGGGTTEWNPAAWAPCLAEVATNPGAAIPPLVWGPCQGGAPGCERLDTSWKPLAHYPSFSPPSVLRRPGGYWLATQLSLDPPNWHMGWYDELGHPLYAARTVECNFVPILLGETEFWFGAQLPVPGSSVYVQFSYDSSQVPKYQSELTASSQGWTGTDDVLALWISGGVQVGVDDVQGNTSALLNPAPGIGYRAASIVGRDLLLRYYSAFERPEGRIWTHQSGAVSPLIQPADDVVIDLKSDGNTLVWLQAPVKPLNADMWTGVSLWTSPFATSMASVLPTKRRDLPGVGTATSSANQGYYAVYSHEDGRIHVYRLSDAHHWAVEIPAGEIFYDVSYVDDTTLFFHTYETIFRVPLNALGPGDP